MTTPLQNTTEQRHGARTGLSSASSPELVTRQRYVIGVFGKLSQAHGAIAAFSPEACEVIVVSEATPERDTVPAIVDNGAVNAVTLNGNGTLTRTLAAALQKSVTFAPLDAQSSTDKGDAGVSPGLQRLFQKLVNHLAAGAVVVIVHAPGADQQIRVSRTLLDAKCDTLLTHDFLPSDCGSPREPAHTEDCCQSCTTRSCGRFDPL